MKMKEFFGFSRPETGPPLPESGNETEDKYTREIEDYRKYTNSEISRLEEKFQKNIKTASPEEFERLKAEKDRYQALLRENLEKVRMNLEEGAIGELKPKKNPKVSEELQEESDDFI